MKALSSTLKKSRQRRSRPIVVLTYFTYAPRANEPAALLGAIFERAALQRGGLTDACYMD